MDFLLKQLLICLSSANRTTTNTRLSDVITSRVTTIDIRTIAQLRTAQVGLSIERYRLATGSLPKTLAELRPTYLDAISKDPFDGKDLRYKKLETGFVIYSIGEDGTAVMLDSL